MKLWGGRFSKNTDNLVDDFNSSISFDKKLYKYDIQGSIAHAKMLLKCNILNDEECQAIVEGLEEIYLEIESGKVKFSIDCEDIHMNIEKLLTEKIGEAGKKLHTARSRNDQVALDLKMYVKDEIGNIKELLFELEHTLLTLALGHTETIMPGYTHLQPAQPVTFGHHLLAYFEMFKRDIERLEDCLKRVDIMPLGSCAMAGTTYDIDRNYTNELLGFSNITSNSMDGVSDRDYVIEFLSINSMIMMHLSRFCEEIIMFCSPSFGFIELDDGFSTGSSIMPQKKNPDVPELIRGKTGRVYGHLMGILTVMKGLPLCYNKDMQEDKEAVFDSTDTVKICLKTFIPMIGTMKVKNKKMKQACSLGFLNATDAADYLVKRGIPFRTAHEIIGKLVLYCINSGKTLDNLSIDEYKNISEIFSNDIYEAIDIKNCVNNRKTEGGPSAEMVKSQIEKGYFYLEEKLKAARATD